MMEMGEQPLILDPVSSELIWNAFNEQAQKLWIKIIIGNVLPDHVHIVIDSNNKDISKIVNLLKWYGAHLYNHIFQHNGPIWADWYSDTYLDNEIHLENAIEYVKNNHFKHQSQSQYVWWETI
jgi:REP element-mobilizing transposase RayT